MRRRFLNKLSACSFGFLYLSARLEVPSAAFLCWCDRRSSSASSGHRVLADRQPCTGPSPVQSITWHACASTHRETTQAPTGRPCARPHKPTIHAILPVVWLICLTLEVMKALFRLYNTYSRNSIYFTAAQILRFFGGAGCGCSFPVLFYFPTFGRVQNTGSKPRAHLSKRLSGHSLYHRSLWNRRILRSKSRPENNWIGVETIKNYRKPLKKVS